MRVARGPKEGTVDVPRVGLRSPRARRKRISRRSLGEEERSAMKARREEGVPRELLEAQLSRILCNVGA